MIEFVNGTAIYSIVPTWGYKDPTTGESNGMMGELLRNEADIAATPFFFRSDRVTLMEYISRPSPTVGAFMFRSPKLSYTNNIYILPFDRLLWMCLALLVIIIAICLSGAMVFELKVLWNSEVRSV